MTLNRPCTRFEQFLADLSHRTLPSGLNHVAYTEVTVPAKQLSVQVQNFDCNRNN